MDANKKVKMLMIHAVRESAGLDEVAKKLHFGSELHVLKKMLSFCPGAEDFFLRNEAIRNMKRYLEAKDFDLLKESRIQFIGATCRLMDSSLI